MLREDYTYPARKRERNLKGGHPPNFLDIEISGRRPRQGGEVMLEFPDLNPFFPHRLAPLPLLVASISHLAYTRLRISSLFQAT
jgi:hypothetical protein